MQRFINIFFLTLNFFSKSFMRYLPVAILTDVLYLVEMIEIGANNVSRKSFMVPLKSRLGPSIYDSLCRL